MYTGLTEWRKFMPIRFLVSIHTRQERLSFYINSVMLPLFYRMEIYPMSLISLYFILYFIV